MFSSKGMSNNRARPSLNNVRRLKELMQKSENRLCADCGAPDPKWASANIGVFLCLKCCGVHRSLGTHISKVLSVTLDDWSDEEIDAMFEVGGNISANAIYESYIPKGVLKPGPDSIHADRLKFIRSKYELQEFLKPSLRIVSFSRRTSNDVRRRNSLESVSDSDTSKEMAGMVEFIGLLKVKVIKGTNLAVRDMLSSDPYVVLSLGQMRVQTAVISSNLNPVWNEELMLSVPHNFKPLKMEVYDYDTFSADDIMGEAEIDIQPLIGAALAIDDPRKFTDMQLGKWLKSHDNALISDSTINLVDGKIKQEMSIKLQKVECGEIELELEWLSLEQ